MKKIYAITLDDFLEGILTKKIENGYKIDELYIPRFFIYYFKQLQIKSVIRGDIGLLEMIKLKQLSDKKGFKLNLFDNEVIPKIDDIEIYTRIAIEKLKNEDIITLVSSQEQQHEYDLYNLKCEVFDSKDLLIKKNPLEKYFDENTMSVHIKEDEYLFRKKGSPKKIEFEKTQELFDNKKITHLVDELLEFARCNGQSYVEKDSGNVVIAQLQNIRTVIVRPPLSEGYEITAVRPITILTLEDYKLDAKIIEKLGVAGGVLISGSPGSGKSTFCQGVAEHLADLDKIVKTIESPRDLVLSKRITQFSLSHSKKGDLANILLLSRPDYSIYDEVRNPEDISLYADLRLAGVGMIGVIHATKPIDSIHRLIGKIELGVIPQVVDTVIFIQKGVVEKVLVLESTVKVPSGMREADLARPVIEIKDFLTNSLEYEIYTYGEQTVVIELSKLSKKKQPQSSTQKIAKDHLENELKKVLGFSDFNFEFISDNKIKLEVPEQYISGIIGKAGKNIEKLEKDLGIKIDIDKIPKKSQTLKDVSYKIQQTKSNLIFNFKDSINYYEIISNNKVIFNGNIGKNNILKIKRKSSEGKIIEKILDDGIDIHIVGK